MFYITCDDMFQGTDSGFVVNAEGAPLSTNSSSAAPAAWWCAVFTR